MYVCVHVSLPYFPSRDLRFRGRTNLETKLIEIIVQPAASNCTSERERQLLHNRKFRTEGTEQTAHITHGKELPHGLWPTLPSPRGCNLPISPRPSRRKGTKNGAPP